MTSRNPARARDPFLRTLRFAASRWRQQWRLALFMSGIVALMAAAELALPLFAGQMVDAMAAPARPRDSAVRDALVALAAIIGFGLALIALRYVLFKTIVRFTLRMMSEVAQDTFRRVQRFSTDWHANSFAGATVRKVSRGMWAFDLLNDTVMMALWPSLRRAGGRDGAVRLALAADGPGRRRQRHRLRALSRSSCRSTTSHPRHGAPTPGTRRMGGALADAMSCNPVVKAFGAEDREDARFGRVARALAVAAPGVTWMRGHPAPASCSRPSSWRCAWP